MTHVNLYPCPSCGRDVPTYNGATEAECECGAKLRLEVHADFNGDHYIDESQWIEVGS